jgi:hypothetical protein
MKKITKSSFQFSEKGKVLLPLLILLLINITYKIKSIDPNAAYFLLLLSGWLIWTFIEYYNHRFRMHGSGYDPSKVFRYEIHILHHFHPSGITITILKKCILFTINIVMIILCILYKNWILLFTWLYTGFVIYTLMQRVLNRKFSAKLFSEVHRFLIHHHCKHPDKWFGVRVTRRNHLFDTFH